MGPDGQRGFLGQNLVFFLISNAANNKENSCVGRAVGNNHDNGR
jgi:hypothetical protein